MEFGPPKKVLNSLEEISPETLESIAQWIENRGLKTPISQVVGYQQIKPFSMILSTNSAITTTSNSWTTTGLGGSTTNLRPGPYLMFISAPLKISSALECVSFGLRINGTDPFASGVGVHGTSTSSVTLEGGAVGAGTIVTLSAMVSETLTGDTSTIQPVWFVSGGTGSIYGYNITVFRIGFTAGS